MNIGTRLVRSAVRSALSLAGAFVSYAGGFLNAYQTTNPKDKTFEFGRPRIHGTANQALAPNLTNLIAQGRHVDRCTCLGRAVVEAWKADIVGSGIDIIPQSNDQDFNLQMHDAWLDWADHALVDGSPLWEWQAQQVGDVVTAGSGLSRIIIDPERVKRGWLPVCILPLEPEWLAEIPVADVPNGHRFIRGVELDQFGRPVAYHLRNPEALNQFVGERVPADEIIHVFEKRRAQQALGEPVLAPAIERIMQDDRLIRSELKGSLAANAPALVIKTPSTDDDNDADGDAVTDIGPGSVARLLPGEELQQVAPERPNALIEPFRSGVRGDVAGACRVGQGHLNRDYSSSTFMNSRMEKMDTKRLQASVKSLLCRMLAGRVYEAAFPWLMIQIGRSMPSSPRLRANLLRYAVRPDEMPYIDPTKDVAASVNSIAANLSTYHIECSARGKDFRQIVAERKLENEQLAKAGLPLPSIIKPSAQPETVRADDEDPEDE